MIRHFEQGYRVLVIPGCPLCNKLETTPQYERIKETAFGPGFVSATNPTVDISGLSLGGFVRFSKNPAVLTTFCGVRVRVVDVV